MTFYMHIMYIEIVGCGKFGCNILKNNKNLGLEHVLTVQSGAFRLVYSVQQ